MGNLLWTSMPEKKKIDIVCCYAREDQPFLDEIKKRLIPMERAGRIEFWDDTDIKAGGEWEEEIKKRLDTAQIILLLVSPDFMASDYCVKVEMAQAMERHGLGNVHVIPIILRPVSWKETPLGKLKVLPTNAVPITSEKWPRQDEAFHDVTEGIRKVVETLEKNNPEPEASDEILKLLNTVSDAFIDACKGKIADELLEKLRHTSVKNAIKRAMGAAIQRYATSELRLDLARPLLRNNGLLTDREFLEELTHLVCFDHAPDCILMGHIWKQSLDTCPGWCNFEKEATRLVENLQLELRGSEIFRPVFDSHSLDKIATNSTDTNDILEHVTAQLTDLLQWLNSSYGTLLKHFQNASQTVHEDIRDYSFYLKEKTQHFVGRQFVFDAIEKFTDTRPSGYYFIRGDPGIGKTALAAQLVKMHGYLHHFNLRSEGIYTAEVFLKNICSQLVASYRLPYTSLPLEATKDAGFLKRLLEEIIRLPSVNSPKVILVIDALDEVDSYPGINPLYLPQTLPPSIFFIVTTRKGPINVRLECESTVLDIEHNSSGNIADIYTYLKQVVSNPGIQAYITNQGIDDAFFTDHLVEKSEGNFMYLRYVLPAIERGDYQDLALVALPQGLQNYYEDHWRRMRGLNEEAWLTYGLPIIAALTIVREPVSLELLADLSNVQDRARVRATLQGWAPFLHEEQIPYQGALQRRYRIYHTSFYDFIHNKDEIGDINLTQAHDKMALYLWSKLYG